MKNETIIEVCIPHQLPPKVSTWDSIESYREAVLNDAICSDMHSYQEWTMADAVTEFGGESEVPAELLEMLKKHGKVVQVNNRYLPAADAPSETDWAFDVVNHDYNAAFILTLDEAAEYVEREKGGWRHSHQGDKVRRMILDILESEIEA
jgi:hypothetical protein